jgi:hypothetical protein
MVSVWPIRAPQRLPQIQVKPNDPDADLKKDPVDRNEDLHALSAG